MITDRLAAIPVAGRNEHGGCIRLGHGGPDGEPQLQRLASRAADLDRHEFTLAFAANHQFALGHPQVVEL